MSLRVALCLSAVCLSSVSACCFCLHVSQCHPLVGTPCHSLAAPPPDSPLYYYFFCIPPSPSSVLPLLLILLLSCLLALPLHCIRERAAGNLWTKNLHSTLHCAYFSVCEGSSLAFEISGSRIGQFWLDSNRKSRCAFSTNNHQ